MSLTKRKKHNSLYTIDLQPLETRQRQKSKINRKKPLKSQYRTIQSTDQQKRNHFQHSIKDHYKRNEQNKNLRNSITQAIQNALFKIQQIQKQKQLIRQAKIISLKQRYQRNKFQLKGQKIRSAYGGKEKKIKNTHEVRNAREVEEQKIKSTYEAKSSITINLFSTRYSVIQNVSKQLGFNICYQNDAFNWNFKWTDVSLGPQFIRKMTKNQRINYFIGISSIARKNLLMVNLYNMKQHFPQQYDFFPQTFQFPTDTVRMMKFYKQKLKTQGKLTFIVKPEAECQGKGIYLCQDPSQIDRCSPSIVQQYISCPMLYEGLKFDFRVYVLLKNVSPLQIYIYKEGLVRLATQSYQQPSKYNLDELCMHLTNYAINKLSPGYKFNKTFNDLSYGHKKSLAEFFGSLGKQCDSSRCWRQIKEDIVKTVISVQPHLHSAYRKAQPKNQEESLCYQVLGFDFMMDDEAKVHLLQVNQSPSFCTQTPLDFLVKNYLIKDTFQVIMFDRQRKKPNSQLRPIRLRTEVLTSLEQINNSSFNQMALQIPKLILGNYEKIYPCNQPWAQRQYEKMLVYSRLHYHNDGNLQSMKLMQQQRKRRPQLKINSGYVQRLSQNHLGRNQPLGTKRTSTLSEVPGNLRLLKRSKYISLRKEVIRSALDPDENYIDLKYSNMDQYHPEYRDATPIQTGKTSPYTNIYKQQDTRVNGQIQIQKGQIQGLQSIEQQLLTKPKTKDVNTNIQDFQQQQRPGIKQEQISYHSKKEHFTSVDKHIKYLNPIQRASSHRVQRQN